MSMDTYWTAKKTNVKTVGKTVNALVRKSLPW